MILKYGLNTKTIWINKYRITQYPIGLLSQKKMNDLYLVSSKTDLDMLSDMTFLNGCVSIKDSIISKCSSVTSSQVNFLT